MKKLNKISLALIMMLSFLFNLIPVTANAEVTNLVTVERSVDPATLYIGEGQEAQVTLNVKGESQTKVEQTDVMLLLDKSDSMKTEGRFDAMKNAANEFIDTIDLVNHSVGIVGFNNKNATTTQPLTKNKSLLKKYVENMQTGNDTYTDYAIECAMNSFSNDGKKHAIVLLTDGEAHKYGVESDEQARKHALEMAQKAKDEGIIFYTIAVLGKNDDPETSAPNELLKNMATAKPYHHFVLGTDGLTELYKSIAGEIGESTAKDIIITETVSPQFEIVKDSYNDNIPVPTVEGNTLTWKMNELNGEVNLTYKIKLKDSVKAGKYKVADPATITYKDYSGKEDTYKIAKTVITVAEKTQYKQPTLSYISASVKEENSEIDRIVKIGTSYFFSDANFSDVKKECNSLALVGNNINPSMLANIYDEDGKLIDQVKGSCFRQSFIISISKKLIQGKYNISVVTPDGKESNKIELQVVELQDSVPDISYVSTAGGFSTRVSEVVKNSFKFVQLKGIQFQSGLKMNIYDENGTLLVQQEQKDFYNKYKARFELSSKLEPGNYKISVTNPNGKESNKLDFKILSQSNMIVPELSYTQVSNIGVKGENTNRYQLPNNSSSNSIGITLNGSNIKMAKFVNIYDEYGNIVEQYSNINPGKADVRFSWYNIKPGKYKIALANQEGQESNKLDFELIAAK